MDPKITSAPSTYSGAPAAPANPTAQPPAAASAAAETQKKPVHGQPVRRVGILPVHTGMPRVKISGPGAQAAGPLKQPDAPQPRPVPEKKA